MRRSRPYGPLFGGSAPSWPLRSASRRHPQPVPSLKTNTIGASMPFHRAGGRPRRLGGAKRRGSRPRAACGPQPPSAQAVELPWFLKVSLWVHFLPGWPYVLSVRCGWCFVACRPKAARQPSWACGGSRKALLPRPTGGLVLPPRATPSLRYPQGSGGYR